MVSGYGFINMSSKIYIPAFLSHLKVNDKGYPIPYFVSIVNGKPDFRLLDARKQVYAVEQKLCAVCGKKLFKWAYYFITGPMGYTNKVSTDPAMHRQCAEYSLQVCPHLYIEKTKRREAGVEHLRAQQEELMLDKPPMLLLVKADKFSWLPNPITHTKLITFRPVSYEIYVYENGLLTKSLMPQF